MSDGIFLLYNNIDSKLKYLLLSELNKVYLKLTDSLGIVQDSYNERCGKGISKESLKDYCWFVTGDYFCKNHLSLNLNDNIKNYFLQKNALINFV